MNEREARTGTLARYFRAFGPSRRLGLAGAALVVAMVALFAGLPQQGSANAQNAYSYTGVASCAGSTCHGRSEGNGALVRQDEIATWQSPFAVSGAHSRAYDLLGSERGQQIAASLGSGSLLDFDWAVSHVVASDKLAAVGEPLVQLTLRVATGAGGEGVGGAVTVLFGK